ncbi:MAG: leucine-rich repeat protein [Alistipes sp.]|nr:leucine-rich repeat protein [Alistipes sp.]
MKRILFLVTFVCAAMFSACEYDDSALWGEIDGVKQELADHERRIAALEELCKQMNTNISALQTAVTALQNNDFVTNVAPITKDGETIGYTVTFSKSGSITIYNGEDGKDGADGEDAVAPVIGVKQDSDGVYYWTLDGEWLTDDAGNKIKAEGKDGKDGEDATDGEDGVTPQLKIEDDYWYVSYDNGATWKRLGKATGDSNTNVTDCDCIIKDVRQDDNNVYFELTDGTIITIPKSNGENNSGDNGDDGDTSATLPPSNEIWYTSTDGKIVEPNNSNAFGANIVSNTYEEGKGVIKFDGDVTEIGEKAFEWCRNLTSITIPDSVTVIGEDAFSDCSSLTSVNIGDSVTTIGRSAFYYCSSLTTITIPDSVTVIGEDAFNYCYSIISITIPDSVTTIGDGTFETCASLTSITIPDSVTTIGERAFWSCSSLTSITIPDSVTVIGDDAFHSCHSLTTITIPDSVTVIGETAFYDCISLKAFYGKFATIDNRALIVNGVLKVFAIGCGATSYTIPNNVTQIESAAFEGCSSLTSITIPNSVTEIESGAFYGCSSLTSITIPDSVTKIGDDAFHFCSSLTSATIGNSVTKIGRAAFGWCSSLTTFYGKFAADNGRCLVNGSTIIAYAEASGTTYTIPDSVTEIGDSAFYYCSSLTTITIPESVTEIGEYAFSWCGRLTSIYCKPTVPPTGSGNMFKSISSLAKIYVPIGSGAAYKAADGWKDYASMIEEKAM